jgi:ribosomal protein S12 methylthiotransferase
VALVSLGCPKNQVDSELILGRLREAGCEIVADPDAADTLVVNTCSFIDRARAESVEALLDAVAWKSGGEDRRVVAAGCLVQRHGDELSAELPELDDLVGLDEISGVATRLARLPASAPSGAAARLPAAGAPRGAATGLFDHAAPRLRLSPPFSAYVKIAEGCDQNCAFCAIPTFRGRARSRPLDDLAAELTGLAREGVVEANLIAQDSTGYGRDLGLRDGLAELVRTVEALPEAPPWVRVHYLYPGRIGRRLLEALAGAARIVPYVDLPLQHAHPDVLRRMGRPGSPEAYLRQLEQLDRALGGAPGRRSGFIVGFPGETDDEFATLCDFVEEAGFDAAGVFAYSHEEGTRALHLDDDVTPEVKEERKVVLEEIVAAVAEERARRRLGEELDVLVEGPAEDVPGAATGRWAGQAPEVDGRVLVESGAHLSAGAMVRVQVTATGPFELSGRVARLERAMP